MTCSTLFVPPHPTDYDSADLALHRRESVKGCQECGKDHRTKGKRVDSRKIANNTYLVRRGDDIAVKLHDTYVVTYHRTNPWAPLTDRPAPHATSLDTGGWLTVTTKDRINACLPDDVRVSSVQGTWEVRFGGWQNPRDVVRYTDGITIVQPYAGGPHVPDERSLLPGEDAHRQDKHNATMRRLIGRYIKGYVGEHQTESSACTLCKTQHTLYPQGSAGRPLYVSIGDAMDDTQHLVDHMIDGVYPMGLIHQAVSAAGYNVNYATADTVKRSLRKYLGTRLYLGATAPAHGKRPITLKESA